MLINGIKIQGNSDQWAMPCFYPNLLQYRMMWRTKLFVPRNWHEPKWIRMLTRGCCGKVLKHLIISSVNPPHCFREKLWLVASKLSCISYTSFVATKTDMAAGIWAHIFKTCRVTRLHYLYSTESTVGAAASAVCQLPQPERSSLPNTSCIAWTVQHCPGRPVFSEIAVEQTLNQASFESYQCARKIIF